MITETNYDGLIYGVCEHCGEESAEIDPNSGWCIDCVEAERFYYETLHNQSAYEEVNFKNF